MQHIHTKSKPHTPYHPTNKEFQGKTLVVLCNLVVLYLHHVGDLSVPNQELKSFPSNNTIHLPLDDMVEPQTNGLHDFYSFICCQSLHLSLAIPVAGLRKRRWGSTIASCWRHISFSLFHSRSFHSENHRKKGSKKIHS